MTTTTKTKGLLYAKVSSCFAKSDRTKARYWLSELLLQSQDNVVVQHLGACAFAALNGATPIIAEFVNPKKSQPPPPPQSTSEGESTKKKKKKQKKKQQKNEEQPETLDPLKSLADDPYEAYSKAAEKDTLINYSNELYYPEAWLRLMSLPETDLKKKIRLWVFIHLQNLDIFRALKYSVLINKQVKIGRFDVDFMNSQIALGAFDDGRDSIQSNFTKPPKDDEHPLFVSEDEWIENAAKRCSDDVEERVMAVQLFKPPHYYSFLVVDSPADREIPLRSTLYKYVRKNVYEEDEDVNKKNIDILKNIENAKDAKGYFCPNVIFFRGPETKGYNLLEETFQLDVLVISSPTYIEKNGPITEELIETLRERLKTIFLVAYRNDVHHLYFYPFGCQPPYSLPASVVAKVTHEIYKKYAGSLDSVNIIFGSFELANGIKTIFGNEFKIVSNKNNDITITKKNNNYEDDDAFYKVSNNAVGKLPIDDPLKYYRDVSIKAYDTKLMFYPSEFKTVYEECVNSFSPHTSTLRVLVKHQTNQILTETYNYELAFSENVHKVVTLEKEKIKTFTLTTEKLPLYSNLLETKAKKGEIFISPENLITVGRYVKQLTGESTTVIIPSEEGLTNSLSGKYIQRYDEFTLSSNLQSFGKHKLPDTKHQEDDDYWMFRNVLICRDGPPSFNFREPTKVDVVIIQRKFSDMKDANKKINTQNLLDRLVSSIDCDNIVLEPFLVTYPWSNEVDIANALHEFIKLMTLYSTRFEKIVLCYNPALIGQNRLESFTKELLDSKFTFVELKID